MEVNILDSLLRREEVVDRFESLIWTERWSDIGDFELVLQSTPANRRRFTVGKRLVVTESVRVMTVETVEDTTDDEGRAMLKVTGRSLEALLEDRAAIGVSQGSNPPQWLPEWGMEGTPEWVARNMFKEICVYGRVSTADIIPNMFEYGNSFPVDSIPEHTFEIAWNQKPASLYAAIKEVCDIYDLGFRLYKAGDFPALYFNVYTGNNRTIQQTQLTPVIFSPALENLSRTRELTTTSKTKNVAYVVARLDDVDYHEIVYPPDVDPDIAGFERRVLSVNATLDTDVIVSDIPLLLQRAGLDELAKNRAFTAFDGEISKYTQYKYGTHYFLGDLVTMQNTDNKSTNMRVTEQIFVSDHEGDRSYPTLAVNLFVTPGSWESWGYQAWEDVAPTEYWDNQP